MFTSNLQCSAAASPLSPAAVPSGPASPSEEKLQLILGSPLSSSYILKYLDCISELFSQTTPPFSHCLPLLACTAKTASKHPFILFLWNTIHPVQSGLSGKRIYVLPLSIACWAHQGDGGPMSGVRSPMTSPGSTQPRSTLGPVPSLPCLRVFFLLHLYVFGLDVLCACNSCPGYLLSICPWGLNSSPSPQEAVCVAFHPLIMGEALSLGLVVPVALNAHLSYCTDSSISSLPARGLHFH